MNLEFKVTKTKSKVGSEIVQTSSQLTESRNCLKMN